MNNRTGVSYQDCPKCNVQKHWELPDGRWECSKRGAVNEHARNIKKHLKFGGAGLVLTAWGLLLASIVDIFHLSAVMVALSMLPVTYALKFVLYRKVFKDA